MYYRVMHSVGRLRQSFLSPPVAICSTYCNLAGGVLTLDGQGDPNSVFIFITSGYLAAAPASQMVLVNSARADHGERRL
jgi:hypothetical protein